MKYIFCSYPEFSDNAMVLLTYMVKNGYSGEFIWLYNTEETIKKAQAKIDKYLGEQKNQVKFIKKNSLKGICHYLTADYSFNTHGMFENFPVLKKHTKVNLWHGMPLKTIGKFMGVSPELKMDYTVSTAEIFDEVMSTAFEISKEQIIKCGLPRNDLLVKKGGFSKSVLTQTNKKILVWLPTYRQSNQSVLKTDGVFDGYSIGGFDLEELKELDKGISKFKAKLIIKLHPLDVLNSYEEELFDNILIYNMQKFDELNVELNEFLSVTDGLITDYSSVYFDYLLTEKPIALIERDQEKYQDSRGFVSKEVFEQFTGVMIENVDSFLIFIEHLALKQENLPKEFFNEYDRAGNNCQFILDYLNIKRT